MKVFFVSRGWPIESDPMWGSFERDQALALSELGHQIIVLSVDSRFKASNRKLGITYQESGSIHIYRLFVGSWIRLLSLVPIKLKIRIFQSLFLKLFTTVTKKEGMPDLLYSHYLPNSSMAIGAKRIYGVPVVGVEHWSELGYEIVKPNILKWAGLVYPNLDILLTVSSALNNNIRRLLNTDSIVVNNMVGKEFYFLSPNKKDAITRFIATGNLIPRKGFDFLIKAFHMAKLPENRWTLDIIGEGPEHSLLQKLIEEYNLQKNVYLRGRMERSEVVGCLQSSDVYVLSSLSETFGVAALEALACGIPVIATNCGGASDFMNKDNGIMCDVGDSKALSKSIEYMYKNYSSYDREKIAQECYNHFSATAISKQLEDIFENVIN